MSAVQDKRAEQQAIRAMVALSLPLTLAQLDPHSVSDLAHFMKCLADAMEAKDAEAAEHARQAIREVFEMPDTTVGDEVGDILTSIRQTPEGYQAVEEVEAENSSFMGRYFEMKAERGLSSQRAVAEAAGISVNTVNAIETERTIPQFRTVEKLAAAFGVTAKWLLTGEGTKTA